MVEALQCFLIVSLRHLAGGHATVGTGHLIGVAIGLEE